MPKKFADGWKCLAITTNVAQIVGLRACFDIGNKPAKSVETSSANLHKLQMSATDLHMINTLLCGHAYERVPWGTIA